MRRPEDDSRYTQLAARVLARRAGDDANASSLADRTAAVGAIERAIQARGRRRFVPWLLASAAAGAAVVFVTASPGRHDGAAATAGHGAGDTPGAPGLAVSAVNGVGVSIEAADGPHPAGAGDRIVAGASIRVPGAGQLLVALDTGTRLRFGASTAARVAALGSTQRFDLQSGTLEAEVAKLPIGGRFLIATDDAEVEVKGTRFEVTVAPERSSCAPFVRTHVVVQEGVVAVRFSGGEVRLPAGSAWPACPTVTASPTPAAPQAPARRVRPARVPAVPVAAATPSPRNDPSTLAAQNDLFAAALAARRRGEDPEAIRWLDRLIARYPDGPLIESARAERRRLVAASGGAEPTE